MSDSDNEGGPPPPPPNLNATGTFKRLSTSQFCGVPSPHSNSMAQSPMSPFSSFRWDRQQSFRLYANRSLGSKRNTVLGESLLDGGGGCGHSFLGDGSEMIPVSPSATVKSSVTKLKNYILLHGEQSVSADSTLPMNIRKGMMVGEGGYAKVYCGVNTTSGEIVAIKELKIGAESSSKDELKTIEDEFALLRQMRHPNVVRYMLFEHSVSQQRCRIVMEFMAGGSTQSLLQKFGPIPESMIKKFAQDMLQGIAFIHKEDIIHRDIKPANILLHASGVLKLADFGCSKRITEINRATNHLIGTPIYMAPEFIKGKVHRKSDIWALGCTIFELATGLPPWHHVKIRQHLPLMFHITTTYETPLQLPPSSVRRLSSSVESMGSMGEDQYSFSAGFLDFMARCFERNVDERPEASELLNHSWITTITEEDTEAQHEIEDMSAEQSTFLINQLTSAAEANVTGPVGADTSWVLTANIPTPQRSPVESPHELPSLHSWSSTGPPKMAPFHYDDVSSLQQGGAMEEQQFLVVNPENCEITLGSTFVAVDGEALDDNGKIGEVEEEGEKSFLSVSKLNDDSNAGSVRMDGPVRMNFTFHAGKGKRVSVGLNLDPCDVERRVIDRRPSFVVAMNDRIRSQIEGALLNTNQSVTVTSEGDDDDDADGDRSVYGGGPLDRSASSLMFRRMANRTTSPSEHK